MRVRIRLDWSNFELNVLEDSDLVAHQLGLGGSPLDRVALTLCRLALWDK